MSTTTQEYIDLYNSGELRQSQLHTMIESLILERQDNVGNNIPTFNGINYKTIYGQTDFYNGHGQLEVKSLKLSEIKEVLSQLQINVELSGSCTNDLFHLKLYIESNGTFSGSICQDLDGGSKLWLSIEEVIIDEQS